MVERSPCRVSASTTRQVCFTTKLVDGMVLTKRSRLPSHLTPVILNRSPSAVSQPSTAGASGALPGFTRNTAWLSVEPQVP